MTRMIIKPSNGSKGLNFDLREIFQALGHRASDSNWTINGLTYVSSDNEVIPILEEQYGNVHNGADILTNTSRLFQTIDGQFRGFDRESKDPWITINAVDSSFWEITTNSQDICSRIMTAFDNVERQDESPNKAIEGKSSRGRADSPHR